MIIQYVNITCRGVILPAATCAGGRGVNIPRLCARPAPGPGILAPETGNN